MSLGRFDLGFPNQRCSDSTCWLGGRPAWMGKPYSMDLRERVVAAVETGGLSCHQAAAQFGVGVSTAIIWVRRLRETGSVAPGQMGVQLVAGIVVHKDTLIVRLKSDGADQASDPPDDPSLTILWHKPPSKRSRQILLPHNASRSDFRPEQFERRARLVSAIARGRRWLDDVVSGRVTTVAQLCTREKCSVRQVNMAISFAFLAPNLVKAAVEGRLPRGIGIERLRDL